MPAWGVTGNIRGPQGSQGVQGSQGSQGTQGTAGGAGTQGTQGNQGAAGSQGAQGTQGSQGAQGSQGGSVLASLTTAVTSSATASTETILLRASIAANNPTFAAAGRPIKIRLIGYSTSTGTVQFRVRAGSAGTTADGQGWQSSVSAAQAANQRASVDAEAVLLTTTTFAVEADAAAGTVNLGTPAAAVAAVTIAPTAAWFIEVSVICSVASGFVARVGSITVV